jgi:hypothetical protein
MLTIGVDSHKRTHTVVVVDQNGRKLGERTVATSAEGHLELIRWVRRWQDRQWALEDCRHLTRRLEADLLKAGERVLRVPPKLMAGARRSARQPGKSAAKPELDRDARRLGAKLALDVTFRVEPLATSGRREISVWANELVIDVRNSLPATIPDQAFADVHASAAWLEHGALVAYLSEEPAFLMSSTAPERRVGHLDADGFVAWVIGEKADQHKHYASRAILAIRSEFDEVLGLRAAFARRDGDIPWWRAIDVWGGGNARVVFG